MEYSNIVSVQGKPTPVAKAATNEFKTDAATKAKDMSHLFGRELEGVSNAWLDPSTSTSLENSGNTGWDQFEANRRLFNVQSSYDENLYTKKLDVNKLSRDAFERAERIAREIEGNVAENVHLREERGQLNESEINEEAMYSGVIRENYPAPETGSWRNSGAQSGSGKSNAGRGAWDRKLQLDNAGRNSGANSKTAGSPSTSSNSYQPPGRRTGTASFADTSVAASPATRSGKTVAPPALAPPATSPVVASAASSAPKPSSSAPPGLIASPVKPVETASASTSGVSTAAVAEDASKKASTSATSANAAKTAANVAPTLSETVAEASVVEEDISKPPAPTPAPAPAPTSAPAASAATTLNANAAEFVPKFTAPVVVPPPPAATIPMGVVPGSTQYGGLPSSVIAPAPGNAGAYGYAQHQASTTGNPTGAAHFYPQSYQSMPQYNYAGSSFYPSAQPLSGPTSVAPPGTTVPASVAPSTPAPAVNGNNSVNTNSVSKASATSQPSTPSLAGMPPPPPSSISRESPSAKPMMSPQALATTVPPQTPPVYANNNNSNSSNNSSYQTFQPQGHHTPHTPTTAPGHHAHATSTTQQTPQQVPMNAPSSWQSQPQDIMNVGAQSFTPVQIAPQQYSYYQPQFYSGTPQMYDYQYYQPVMPNGAPVVASGGAQGAPWMIYDNAQSFVVTPGTTTTPGAMLSNRPTNASSGNTNVTSSPATNPMNGNTSNNVNITPNNNNNANNSNTNTPTNTPAYVDPNTYMMYQAYIPQGMVHHMQTQQVPMQAYTHFVQTPQGAQQQQQAGAGAPVQANALPYIPYPVAANGQQQQVQHLQMMPNNTGYAYPNPNVTGVHPVVGHNAGNMYNSYTPNNMMSANGGISGGDKRNRYVITIFL